MSVSINEKKVMLGLNISYYRKARSMTQTELAEQLEITSNYLSQVERGSKILSVAKIFRAAEILGVDEKDFWDFSRNKN